MKVWLRWIVIAAVLGGTRAWCACGAAAGIVRDWGLHREWRIAVDCAHPERPGRLEEMHWQTPPASRHVAIDRHDPGNSAVSPREVRPGMAVTVEGENPQARIELRGTALTGGDRGVRVAVRAGVHGAVLHGIVRGPALVELSNAK